MNNIRPIAIYLPQFHPIPENDVAWGNGFTEWTNVKKAVPLFEGHYQPHVPHESVGYYDLRDPDVLVKQAEMAKQFSIYGFAFYHYWFNGKRLLNLPIDNMLETGKPDFPFCYIWANENWTKRWDGLDEEVIIKQEYSFEDDRKHIKFLCENVFSDKRYITIDNKPVFMVYRTELLPDIKITTDIWRNEAKKLGYKDLYLVRVENFKSDVNPIDVGFDAAMEFAPNMRSFGNLQEGFNGEQLIYRKADFNEIVSIMLSKKYDYKIFRCVFPSWDNSARKKNNIYITSESSPELFAYFFNETVAYTLENFSEKEQFLFINAWNEWAEGCHIEPDQKNGYAFLEGIKNSLQRQPIPVPKKYFESIEKNRRELIIQNSELLNECRKYKKAYLSKDYKVGRLILDPLRKVKRFLF